MSLNTIFSKESEFLPHELESIISLESIEINHGEAYKNEILNAFMNINSLILIDKQSNNPILKDEVDAYKKLVISLTIIYNKTNKKYTAKVAEIFYLHLFLDTSVLS